jgi:hypothetical protein
VNAAARLTAITDLLLAAEVLFLAGRMSAMPKARLSAAWFWNGVMLLMGIAALGGAINHGFFELSGLPRYWIERPDWIVLAAMTFCLLMTIAAQFFTARARRAILVIGLMQFAADSVLALRTDSFLVVVLNYAPVMILMLVMNIIGLPKRTGSWQMIAGILVMFAASAVQAAGVDTFSPLDHNGIYHLVSMAGVALLYLGGLRLKTA